MSVEEVRKQYPESKQIAPDAKRTYKNGAVVLLVIENFKLVDSNFLVEFAFLDKKLNQVTLRTDYLDKVGKDNLYEALVRRYGQPISTNRDSLGNTFNWASGKTNIYMMSIRDFVQVGYEIKIGKESDKL